MENEEYVFKRDWISFSRGTILRRINGGTLCTRPRDASTYIDNSTLRYLINEGIVERANHKYLEFKNLFIDLYDIYTADDHTEVNGIWDKVWEYFQKRK